MLATNHCTVHLSALRICQ